MTISVSKAIIYDSGNTYEFYYLPEGMICSDCGMKSTSNHLHVVGGKYCSKECVSKNIVEKESL